MTIREQLELRELEYLSSYAALSKDSKGRKRKEEPCDIRPDNTTFVFPERKTSRKFSGRKK